MSRNEKLSVNILCSVKQLLIYLHGTLSHLLNQIFFWVACNTEDEVNIFIAVSLQKSFQSALW